MRSATTAETVQPIVFHDRKNTETEAQLTTPKQTPETHKTPEPKRETRNSAKAVLYMGVLQISVNRSMFYTLIFDVKNAFVQLCVVSCKATCAETKPT